MPRPRSSTTDVARNAAAKGAFPSNTQQVVPLGDATADIFFGANLSREARYSRVASDPEATVDVPVLHVKDVRDGLLAPRADLNEFAFSRDSQLDRYYLRADDVVVTARGTLLKCALVIEKEHIGIIPSSNIIVVRGTRALRAELILAFLRHARTQATLLSESAGASLPTLSIKSLARLPIGVPPPDEQETLARVVRLGEIQYATAIEAAQLRREIALEVVTRGLVQR